MPTIEFEYWVVAKDPEHVGMVIGVYPNREKARALVRDDPMAGMRYTVRKVSKEDYS